MNFKTTYILFGALVLLVGVMLVSVWYHREDRKRTNEMLFPKAASEDKDKQIRADDVNRVVIQRKSPADSEVVFERGKDRAWRITAPLELRADSSRVTNMIESLLTARIDTDTRVESVKSAGLDSPQRIVTLYAKEKDRELTLKIGEVTLGKQQGVAFVQSSDWGAKPLAVQKTDLEATLENLGYFRSKDLLGEGPSSDVRDIKISQDKKGTLELRKEQNHWRFVKPAYGDAEIDATFLTNVDNVKVDYRNDKENDFVRDGVTDLARIDKDLPKSEQLHITVERVGEDKKPTTASLVVLVGKLLPPDTRAEPEAKLDKKDEGKYYAYIDRGKKGKDVVKVSASSIKPFIELLEHPEEKRNKNLVALEPFKAPDAIDVKNPYGLLEFRKPEGKSWQLYRDGKAHPTGEAEVRALIDQITKGKAVSFPDPKRRKELGLERPDVEVVKIWSDSLEKDDSKARKDSKDKDKKKGKAEARSKARGEMPSFKKDSKPVTELRFGNREGDNVAVERLWGKDSTLVMVPAAILEQVRQRPLAYYDKTVPGFGPGFGPPDTDVTKLILSHDGEATELSREKPGAPWKFVRPPKAKGRNANPNVVNEVLGDLNKLVVREVVSEKASTTDLKNYGLASPAYRAIVTLTKDKTNTTHTYLFGKESSGKGYYARVSGKDTIYLVDGRVIDAMKKELRDTTVFEFDPKDVTALKLTGWRNVRKAGITLTMEQAKEGEWKGKDCTPDSAKVNDLLGGLAHLRAERFVPVGGGPKDEKALRIEITLKDKKVLELNVGGAEGNAYHATSNQFKGEAFLVPKEPFEKVREAPRNLEK